MTDINNQAHAPKKKHSWRVIAISALLAMVATVGFTAVADSYSFQVRGGAGSGAVLKCPGGMDRLAHPFDEGFTTVFPGDPEVMVEIVNTIPVDFFLLEKVTTGTHGGTHLDAPRHFLEDGRSVDQLDATEFVWPAYVIDVRERVNDGDRDFQLERSDIREYERENGRIKKGSMVIIQTGHDQFYGNSTYVTTNHPGFSGEAVTWMFEKRDIGGVGSDGLGPDATIDEDFAATFNALAADGVAIPGLNNLDTMNAKGDIIIASAVPLVGGSGYQVDPLACHGNRTNDHDDSWDDDDQWHDDHDDDDDQGDDD